MQRILLTASRLLYQGESAGQVAASLRATYSHITETQAQGAVERAIWEREAAKRVASAAGSSNVFYQLGELPGGNDQRVADVDVSWIDPAGNEQHRTVRVRYGPGDTVDTFNDRARQMAQDMINNVSGEGSDTFGVAPPDGEFDLTPTVFL